MKGTHDGRSPTSAGRAPEPRPPGLAAPEGDPAAPRWLEMRHLRLVRAVTREGSVTRAARVLHLSQSAVSHQLLAIEDDLGVRLFDRVGKRMSLTAAGGELLALAERVLPDVARAERSIVSRTARARTKLRVTSSCFTSYHWLPLVLPGFAAAHPGVEIRVVLEATRRAVEALAADEVDLAITTEPPSDRTYAREQLFVEEIVAVTHPSHPFAARAAAGRALRWRDLRGTKVLVHDVAEIEISRLTRAVEGSGANRAGAALDVLRVPLTESIVELARAGIGVGVVGRSSVATYARAAQLAVVPVVPHARRTFWAAWRTANPRALPIEELIAAIRAELRTAEGARGSP